MLMYLKDHSIGNISFLSRCPLCSDAERGRRSGCSEGVSVPLDPLSPSSAWKCLSCGAETEGAEADRIGKVFDALRGRGGTMTESRNLFFNFYESN